MIEDWKLHLGMGCVTLASTVLILWVDANYGRGAAAALATSLIGIGYELVQLFRKEGDPSPRDAAITAAPGWIFWLLTWIGSL